MLLFQFIIIYLYVSPIKLLVPHKKKIYLLSSWLYSMIMLPGTLQMFENFFWKSEQLSILLAEKGP